MPETPTTEASPPLDLDLVRRTLEGEARPIDDPPLREILRLANDGESLAAARCARDALERGVTDIRAICFYLLGVFVEGGPGALEGIFSTLAWAIRERWDRLEPDERRERAVDSAISALFRTTLRSIDFREAVRDEVWLGWLRAGSAELGRSANQAAGALWEAIEARIAENDSTAQLAGMKVRIEQFFSSAPSPAEEERGDSETAGADRAEAREGDRSQAPEGQSGGRDVPGAGEGRTVEVSAALAVFMNKIDTFADLCQRDEMVKAAIVAEDVLRDVESFDPRVYLPKVLAPFFKLFNQHVEEILPHREAAGSPQWKSLEQLYKVDLESFLEA